MSFAIMTGRIVRLCVGRCMLLPLSHIKVSASSFFSV